MKDVSHWPIARKSHYKLPQPLRSHKWDPAYGPRHVTFQSIIEACAQARSLWPTFGREIKSISFSCCWPFSTSHRNLLSKEAGTTPFVYVSILSRLTVIILVESAQLILNVTRQIFLLARNVCNHWESRRRPMGIAFSCYYICKHDYFIG